MARVASIFKVGTEFRTNISGEKFTVHEVGYVEVGYGGFYSNSLRNKYHSGSSVVTIQSRCEQHSGV